VKSDKWCHNALINGYLVTQKNIDYFGKIATYFNKSMLFDMK